MEGLESCEWRMELEMGVALLLPTGCLHACVLVGKGEGGGAASAQRLFFCAFVFADV